MDDVRGHDLMGEASNSNKCALQTTMHKGVLRNSWLFESRFWRVELISTLFVHWMVKLISYFNWLIILVQNSFTYGMFKLRFNYLLFFNLVALFSLLKTLLVTHEYLWLCKIFTKSIILKCSFCHSRIATPQYVWWSTSRSKCRKAKGRQGKYGQYYSNQNVNTAIDVTGRN